MPEQVYVVGARGDLGSQLLAILQEAGFMVTPIYRNDNLSLQPDKTNIVHWCAPLDAISGYLSYLEHFIANIQSGSLHIILHDSVMARSQKASQLLLAKNIDNVEIVHMLMNQQSRVIISSDSSSPTWAKEHFIRAKMSPKLMSATEHDKMMGVSQSMIALLCKEVLPVLQKYSASGDLTPSGEALIAALQDRQSHWTDSTIDSILNNPYLRIELEDMIKDLE